MFKIDSSAYLITRGSAVSETVVAADGAGLCRNAESKDADVLLIILGKAIYLIELTDPSGSQ